MALELNNRVFQHFVECQATLLHVLVYNGYEDLALREIHQHSLPSGPPSTSGRYIDAQCGSSGTSLHIAVERDNVRLIRMFLSNGADPNAQCDGLGTALHVAVNGKDTEIGRTILSSGADPNTSCDGLGTALHVVASRCSTMRKHPSSPPSHQFWTNWAHKGDRPRLEENILLATGEFISALLSSGADINRQCGGKGTALHVAVKHSDTNIINLLLTNGADINICSEN